MMREGQRDQKKGEKGDNNNNKKKDRQRKREEGQKEKGANKSQITRNKKEIGDVIDKIRCWVILIGQEEG